MLGTAIRTQWAALRPEDEVVGISRHDADLRDRAATLALIGRIKPDAIIHCAATVGGIAANVAHPTAYLSDNLLLDSAVINGSMEVGVRSFIYIGSSCMYPRDYRQPLVETDLLAAPLEPTNEGYAIAKIAGSKLCEYISREHGLAYKTIIPSNLYGPHDDYDSGKSHLVAAALSKMHKAKATGAETVEIWGDGSARREFTYVEDLAQWVVSGFGDMASWPPMMNVGYGEDHSVNEFYAFAKAVVGYKGEFVHDTTKPAGMHQKLMDSTIAKAYGWQPTTRPQDGMARAYEVYLTESSTTNTEDL